MSLQPDRYARGQRLAKRMDRLFGAIENLLSYVTRGRKS